MDRALRVTRLEVWSDVAFAGGVRLAFIPDFLKGVMESRELNGRERLVVPLSRTSRSWADIEHGRVIRAFYSDRTWTEWRIVKFDDAHERSNALTAVVECESILYDLGTHDIITRVEANGTVNHDFDLYQLTPSEHVDVMLGGFGNYLRAAPTYFAKGTIAPGGKIDFEYRGDSPLSALRELVELCSTRDGVPYELECTPDGVNQFLVHIRQVGANAGKVYFWYAKNLTGVKQESDGSELATRIYPRGPEIDGYHHTMAEAQFRITAIAGAFVTLEAGVLPIDDQLNTLWLERVADGVRVQIVDTLAATNQLQLTSGAGFAVGQLVSVRKDANGTRLTYLEHPARKSLYKLRTAVIDRPDLPPADNLVPNAFLDAWSGGLPVSWAAVGGAAIAQNTDPLYRRYGSASAFVVASGLDAGIETNWIPIAPTEMQRYGTGQFSLLVRKGTYRVELVVSNGSVETVLPDPTQQKATAPASIDWIDRFGIGGVDLFEMGATQFKLRMVADGLDDVSLTAEAYLDAVMMTQTASGSESFFAGRTSNELWKAGQEALLTRSLPKLAFEIDVVDLYAVDRTAFAFDKLVLGGPVQTIDKDLDLNFETRLVQYDIDRTMPGVAKVWLSSRFEDLIGLLGKQERRRRLTGRLTEPFSTGVHCDPILDEDTGQLFLVPNRGPGADAVKYLVSLDDPPTRQDVIDNGTASAASIIPVHTFGSVEQHLWVGVVATQYSTGVGTQGELRLLPYKFRPGTGDSPVIWALPIAPSADNKEAVRLTLVDDGDLVALFYRTYTRGEVPPPFLRVPFGSGFVSDPLVQEIEVNKPAEGDVPVVIEAYGEDNDGNRTMRNTYLEIDGDAVPSGAFGIAVDERNGDIYVVPSTLDVSDTGSWRFRVLLAPIGSNAHEAPAFDDLAADEYKGTTWGIPVKLAQKLTDGRQVNVAGYFCRTTSTSAAQQQVSRRTGLIISIEPLGRRKGEAVKIELGLQAANGQLTISVTDIDAGAGWWKCWARRGAWPTIEATNDGNARPDIAYQIWDGPESVRQLSPFATENGTYYVAAQAYDLLGLPGPIYFASVAISAGGGNGGGGGGGGGGTGAQLSNLTVRNNGADMHQVRWDLNTAAATGHRVVISRYIDGLLDQEFVTYANARSPETGDATSLKGGYDAPFTSCAEGSSDFCRYRQYEYFVELWSTTGPTLVHTYTAARFDWGI